MEPAAVKSAVTSYYGTTLHSSADLKTCACVPGAGVPPGTARLLRNIHPEVLAKTYGCGSPLPDLAEGLTILDLGCGAGRDVYLCAQLVGEHGRALGVDMTTELLDVAGRHEEWHASRFGFPRPNTRFLAGEIDHLAALGFADGSVDVVTTNCVLNLLPSAGKEAALREAYRVLKPGGELLLSDVVTDRRVPLALQGDTVLWGECLAGALYRGDLARLLTRAGFIAAWSLECRGVDVKDPTIRDRVGLIAFSAETVRAFKLAPDPLLEDAREDYGQTATYNGGVAGHPHAYKLAKGLVFVAGVATPVDGTTAIVLLHSRYASVFTVTPAGEHQGGFAPSEGVWYDGAGVGEAGRSALDQPGCCG